MERLLDLLGYKNPSIRTLEVGAGTGSVTTVAFKILGEAKLDAKRYSDYMFTDVLGRFLQPAQEKFAAI